MTETCHDVFCTAAEAFRKYIIPNGLVMLFKDVPEEAVYSLSIAVKECPDYPGRYMITHCTLQEECGHIHNVACLHDFKIPVYDVNTEQLITDGELYDRYNDGFDMKVSEAFDLFFQRN